MNQESEIDLALLCHPGGGPQCRTHSAFQAAEGALDLPPLAVGFLGEIALHDSAVLAAWFLSAGTAQQRRNNALGGEVLSDEAVQGFGVIGGIEKYPSGWAAPLGAFEDVAGVARVVAGTLGDFGSHEEVAAAVADRRELRPVASQLPFSAAKHVIPRNATGLQPGGVASHRGTRLDQAALICLTDGLVEQLAELSFFKSRRSA